MFEGTRAIVFYKRMLNDLIELKQIREKTGGSDEFNRGYVLVPSKYVNDKLLYNLSELAEKDNYNFSASEVSHIDGDRAFLCVIDDETPEYKEMKRFEIEESINSFFESIEKPACKILYMEDYRKK